MQKLQRFVKNLLFSQQKPAKRKHKGSSVAALDRVNLSLARLYPFSSNAIASAESFVER